MRALWQHFPGFVMNTIKLLAHSFKDNDDLFRKAARVMVERANEMISSAYTRPHH